MKLNELILEAKQDSVDSDVSDKIQRFAKNINLIAANDGPYLLKGQYSTDAVIGTMKANGRQCDISISPSSKNAKKPITGESPVEWVMSRIAAEWEGVPNRYKSILTTRSIQGARVFSAGIDAYLCIPADNVSQFAYSAQAFDLQSINRPYDLIHSFATLLDFTKEEDDVEVKKLAREYAINSLSLKTATFQKLCDAAKFLDEIIGLKSKNLNDNTKHWIGELSSALKKQKFKSVFQAITSLSPKHWDIKTLSTIGQIPSVDALPKYHNHDEIWYSGDTLVIKVGTLKTAKEVIKKLAKQLNK